MPKQARASVVRLGRRAAAIGGKGSLTVRDGGPFWGGFLTQRARWFGPQPVLMGLSKQRRARVQGLDGGAGADRPGFATETGANSRPEKRLYRTV